MKKLLLLFLFAGLTVPDASGNVDPGQVRAVLATQADARGRTKVLRRGFHAALEPDVSFDCRHTVAFVGEPESGNDLDYSRVEDSRGTLIGVNADGTDAAHSYDGMNILIWTVQVSGLNKNPWPGVTGKIPLSASLDVPKGNIPPRDRVSR